jgi:diphosphate-dependent phosphofructokinase
VLNLSPLQKARINYKPKIPKVLEDVTAIQCEEVAPCHPMETFPLLSQNRTLVFKEGKKNPVRPIRVGVLLSGGQAPGGHNVICGLFDAIKMFHNESQLFGFLGGPSGLIKNKHVEITATMLEPYRNQGGFDLIGSGRTKIEKEEHYEGALASAKALRLDGLVIIGGDDSNTNAAFLAEYFLEHNLSTCVVGVPKTIDGDLQNEFIEIPFGFDTACKLFSETIGNIARDALSAKKYYFFIKLMGRSASHIALECALQTHPNLTLISEEIQEKGGTLLSCAHDIASLIAERSRSGKDYGVILLPEGIIEFLKDVKELIREFTILLAPTSPHVKTLDTFETFKDKVHFIESLLTPFAKEAFDAIPVSIQEQLLLDRDPHGNVQVSKIETERLFMGMVEKILDELKEKGEYTGTFSPVPIFCGYEGRSGMPSNFDADYTYCLGRVAATLIEKKKTGFMATIQNLAAGESLWQVGACPLHTMMHFEERDGKMKAVIKKAHVDLSSPAFREFEKARTSWRVDDSYLQIGPIQFFGPSEFSEGRTLSLQLGMRS